MKLTRIGFWIKTASLFLIRSGRSAAAISMMVVTAVSALIFLSALAVGVNDAMIRNSVQFYSGHVTGFGLPPSLAPARLMGDGVSAVLKRVPVSGILSSARGEQTVVLTGIDPDLERNHTAIPKKVLSGRYPQMGEPGVLLSRQVAERLQVGTGDAIRFGTRLEGDEVAMRVSGIYNTGIDSLDREIAFCPLDLRLMESRPWTAAVFLREGVSPERVIDRYSRSLSPSYRFESWESLMPDLRQLIDLEYLSMGIVMILVFAVVAVGIACAFVIFILKNLREYGILKAMGVTSREMDGLIVLEVTILNSAASCAGILIGAMAVLVAEKMGGIDLSAFTSHNRYFAVSGVIYPRLTPFSLWISPILSVSFGMISAVWPAVLVSRKKAAEIFRMA